MNTKEANLERLGRAEHARWAAWVRSHISKGESDQGTDTVHFPASYIEHLQTLCDLDYDALAPAEQDKDKKVVYEFLGDIPFVAENLPDCPYGPVEDFWSSDT